MALIPTAFGDVPIDEARYHCAVCDINTMGPDDTGRGQKLRPVCSNCGGPTSYNGSVIPEPMASQGWNSRAIAAYFRGTAPAPVDTQLELIARGE